jgi:membrane associated rhomboid family serine protease
MRLITERLSPTIKALVVATALAFGFYAAVKEARPFVEGHLALGPAVLQGEVWQLVTSLFVHLEPVGFFFDLLGLWFVGATIEQIAGRRRFLTIFFVPAIAANAATAVVWLLAGSAAIQAGSSLAVLSLFVAFGRLFGRTPARVLGGLVVEARVLAAILVGFSLLADLMRLSVAALAADVVAIGLAYLLAGAAGGEDGPLARFRGRRSRAKLEVLEGGKRDAGRRDDRPRYLN